METSTIVILVLLSLIIVSLFFIALGIGGLHLRQKEFQASTENSIDLLKNELLNMTHGFKDGQRETPAVNVHFPFDQLFEISSKLEELTHLTHVNGKLIGLTANAAAANLARIEARDILAPESAESLRTLRNAITQTLQFFYGVEAGEDGNENNVENNNQ